jgi:hypothetical protein
VKLLGLVFDNFGLKVLALGMAWAVWFMVSQSLSDEQPVAMQLRISVDDASAVKAALIDPPAPLTTVTITVAGPAREVEVFQSVASRAEAIIQVGREYYPTDMEKQAEFRLEDVQVPNLADFPGLRAVAMDPKVIRLNVERMEERDNVPVERPLLPELLSETVVTRIVTWDTVAHIRASAKHLAKRLASIETSVDPQVLLQLAGSLGDAPVITEEVPLVIDPLQAPLFELVEPKRLTVRLELRQMEDEAFTVPVRILYDAVESEPRRLRFSQGNDLDPVLRDIYQPGVDGAPPTLRLVLEGSPANLASVDPAELVVFVLAGDVPADEVLANVRIRIAGLPLGVRIKQPITLAVEREP